MRTLEVIAAVVVSVILFMILPIALESHSVGEGLQYYAEESLDKLLSDVSAEKRIDAVRYQEFTQILVDCGFPGSFELEVYTYEIGIDGSEHRYATTWEEITEAVMTTGEYLFPRDCYVKARVYGLYPDRTLLRVIYGREEIEKSIVLGSGV